MGLVDKIKRRIQMTSKIFNEDIRFSKRFAFYRMIDDLTWRMHLKTISEYFHRKKDTFVLKYLETNLFEVINKYKNDNYRGEYVENVPIWVCWWTGEENAPDLVKQCIKSIRKNAGMHPVNIITEKTYLNYLEIPSYMLMHVKNESMCFAHLADYIRVSLLEKYGGLWLDATIYCAKQIPESYFENEFFTCKSEAIHCRYISNYRWTTFCLAGWKDHVTYRFLKEVFETYWQQKPYAIDYLVFDYLIQIGYRHIKTIKNAIDLVDTNNLHRDDLQVAMNNAVSAIEFNKYLDDDTVLYKLSWREQYAEKTTDGEKSIYAMFLEMDI